MVEGYSDRSHEISLDSCYLFASIPDVHECLKHQPSCRCVNYETGVVVEIFDWTGERIKRNLLIMHEVNTGRPCTLLY